MAASTPAMSPDSLIQIKVVFTNKDETRRLKLPLRELGANSLPDKLRSFLGITTNQVALFERFSDSSSSYIPLDSNNLSVYKQLYRAAKAKSKLKIRVTATEKATPEPSHVTKPTSTLPERLSARTYVHPYVSESGKDEKEVEPQNRVLKTAHPDSSETTLVPPAKSSTETLRPSYLSPASMSCNSYHWPVSKEGDHSEATKAIFEKKLTKNPPAKENLVDKDVKEEAPVPRSFTDREGFLAQQSILAKKFNAKHYPAKFGCARYANSSPGTSFTICCNNCDKSSSEAHWHCGTCRRDDFDLCGECVDKGHHCDNDEHFLVKRFVKDGSIVSSTTEIVLSKKNSKVEEKVPGAFTPDEVKREETRTLPKPSRTCNSCVQVFNESNFVTCVDCDDYDLCLSCHVGMQHGHHPKHTFEPATKDVKLDAIANNLCGAGRNISHNAICDICDQYIIGIRHKCLDCPDWDSCSNCVASVKNVHPGHRFVPLYETLPSNSRPRASQHHHGILCDGPLCVGKKAYIVGVRYKCAVCHDTDFCASCEALPKSTHNKTHPLIKFKTAVNNVSVTTMGETDNGETMRVMGDRPPQTSSKSTETDSVNAATQVQNLAEAKPEPTDVTKEQTKDESRKASADELRAVFVRDTMVDGSVLSSNEKFKQTWTLRNPGPVPWPKGCAVCFVGGDGMLDVDSEHPSHISELRKAIQSNIIERVVNVGEEIEFTVSMKTPKREGKAISYWRLKTDTGVPFGHKLWCDVNVVAGIDGEPSTTHIEDISKSTKIEDDVKKEEMSESNMIFPKLEKESPVASTHEANPPAPIVPGPNRAQEKELLEDVESLELDSDSDEAFLTDEEYELIASDDDMETAKNGKK